MSLHYREIMIKIRRIRAIKLTIIFLSIFLLSYLMFVSNNSVYLDEYTSDSKSPKSAEKSKKDSRLDIKAEKTTPVYVFPKAELPNGLVNVFLNKQSHSTTSEIKSTTPANLNGQYFAPNITKSRIDTLFKIITDKEESYGDVLDKLNVISFKNLVKSKVDKQPLDARFDDIKLELNNYLDVRDNEIVSSDKFLDFLWEKSMHHSFKKPRTNVNKSDINEASNRPVIVTAANMHYYEPLQATVYHIHQHFPEYKLIIYDLGLTSDMLKTTKNNCKCEVRSYDPEGIYQKTSPHVADLKTYAWKPLIVQEALKEHETVLYVDSSIRFLSGQLKPVVDACRDVGMLTQFIGLKLTCYTNPKMFDWFHESVKSFEHSFTIEANILMFHRSFLTSLIMKAWVTCALDQNCIAPPGSTISGCCGCHRFDQDGLSIINSFFFGQPQDHNFLPAYSFTTQESYFFEIKRYAGMRYFTAS